MEILIAFIIIIPAALALFFFGIRGALGDKSNQLEKAKKLSQQGQYEEAINVYNNLILKEQFNPMYHMLLADAYYASNNYQRAVVEYEIALKDQQKLSLKDIFTVNKYLGLSYYRIQNFPKAFLSLYNAFYNDPQDATVCLFLGLVYTSQKKFAKAMDFFSKGENIDSMNFDLRYYSGMIAAHLGKRDIAIRSLIFAKKIRPSDVNVDLYIGALFIENRDYMNGIRHLKYAAKMIPDMTKKMQAFLLLGEGYKGLGLIEDTVTALELARQETDQAGITETDETKKNILYQLGMAYVKGGHLDKGMDTWNMLKQSDFFYKDVKELTSVNLSEKSLNTATDRWMVMPALSSKEILPIGDLIAKKMFDIENLEKTLENTFGKLDMTMDDTTSLIDNFKSLQHKRFADVSKSIVKYMGFVVSKEITIQYDSDFRDGKAVGFVGRKNNEDYLIVIKRYDDNVSGVVLLNALGSAKSMNIPRCVMIITSKYNEDAVRIAQKNTNMTIVDRKGLLNALKVCM